MQNIPATADEKLQALRKCAYFSSLEEVILVGLLPGVNLVRFEKGEVLSFLQVAHRMARLLCQMTPEQLSGEAGTRLRRDQLAARLGTVREVAARALRELERSGAIKVDRRGIRILDGEILRQWAQGPN